jgi:hypothetical protein
MQYIGIDGEGAGRAPHRYTLLAARDRHGRRQWVRRADLKEGLSTEECLDLIGSLPTHNTLIFAYSFNYDLTKILQDVPDRIIYKLFHSDKRAKNRFGMPKAVRWGERWSFNLLGSKFTLTDRSRITGIDPETKRPRYKKVVIWDIFKFFAAKFVTSLKNWKVGEESMLARMSDMKDKRSDFENVSKDQILEYCLEECQCIAELGGRLVEAHETAGLKLRSYHGAGSSGGAMLTKMGIKELAQSAQYPEEMKPALACAFFGGRFENSVIGPIKGPLHAWDISSAYPYHTTFLPCLEHGEWRFTHDRSEIESARAACVNYELPPNPSVRDWGPFPFRDKDGSICFPTHSGGGWVWKEEFLAGERAFPNVRFKAAWVYHTDCTCQPFKEIPEYYLLRIKLGKEGPGIVVKLGINSCYGKLAQSLGNAPFNNWIWAGMITSGCRAQILDMMALHKDRSNLLMVATDGIVTREELTPPTPRETGTGHTGKPLGGWEHKSYERGMFFARPGIYFPLNPTEKDLADVKARGLGKKVLFDQWKKIVDSWEKHGVSKTIPIASISRFVGAKSAVHFNKTLDIYWRKETYGEWITQPNAMSFNPLPKRDGVNPDGVTLTLRSFPETQRSVPYKKAVKSQEAKVLQHAFDLLMEQPDADYDLDDTDFDT